MVVGRPVDHSGTRSLSIAGVHDAAYPAQPTAVAVAPGAHAFHNDFNAAYPAQPTTAAVAPGSEFEIVTHGHTITVNTTFALSRSLTSVDSYVRFSSRV